jgi:hypothetical protein
MREALWMLTLALTAGPAFVAAQGGTPPTEAEAARLIRASPAIAGKSAYSFERVVEMLKLEAGGQIGWMVEFEWKEAGRLRKGVTAITRSENLKANQKAFFSQGGWSMVAVMEDIGAREVMAKAQASRISAFEASAIGDIRTVISGEMAYSMSNEGFYDELRCLVEPGTCLPSYANGSPTFLDSSLLQAEKFGYRRTFHPGPKATRRAKSSPTSVTAFAFTAVPLKPGETGNRGFCGDASGRVCFTSDGSLPKVVNGECDTACMTLK